MLPTVKSILNRYIMPRILIVDDECLIRYSLIDVFKQHGYETSFAKCAEDASEQLEKRSFDLVLTDYKMRGRTGLDLVVEIKKKYPKTKVFLMTAFTSQIDKERSLSAGADEFIPKPFDLEKVVQLARKILGT